MKNLQTAYFNTKFLIGSAVELDTPVGQNFECTYIMNKKWKTLDENYIVSICLGSLVPKNHEVRLVGTLEIKDCMYLPVQPRDIPNVKTILMGKRETPFLEPCTILYFKRIGISDTRFIALAVPRQKKEESFRNKKDSMVTLGTEGIMSVKLTERYPVFYYDNFTALFESEKIDELNYVCDIEDAITMRFYFNENKRKVKNRKRTPSLTLHEFIALRSHMLVFLDELRKTEGITTELKI